MSDKLRVLHIVKTSDGARWAALQAHHLTRLGVEVHVALPSMKGRTMPLWRSSGAHLHHCDLSFSLSAMRGMTELSSRINRIVDDVQPAIIHTHFVSSALAVRLVLGRNHQTPRIFQVPGPLHLEHAPYRIAEIATAGPSDCWIASSRCIRSLYIRAGIEPNRVFLSYYGFEPSTFTSGRSNVLRQRLGIPSDIFVVGNINLIYRPKLHLGQFTGIKGHSCIIEALDIVTHARSDVFGVLVGGPWGKAGRYFEHLRAKAARVGRGRILMPGFLSIEDVPALWADFDCAVHVPVSENCGGVVEPLAAGVPTIAGRVGGLPEVIIDGVTGTTVPVGDPTKLAEAIVNVLENPERARCMAAAGRELVGTMFSAERSTNEVKQIYDYVLRRSSLRPTEFDSHYAAALSHTGKGILSI